MRKVARQDESELSGAMPATLAGRYLLERAVARGVGGPVWRAHTLATREAVALKFVPAAVHGDPRRVEECRALIANFGASRDPGIVVASELAVQGRFGAVVTPWIMGLSLEQMLEQRGGRASAVEEVRPWVAALLAALDDVHRRGLVHGALHPGVIFPMSDGVRVVGWATHAWLRGVLRNGREEPGRLRFMSPAARRGERPGTADDIYAVGAILYTVLTGRPPETSWWRRRPRGMARRSRERRGSSAREVSAVWERSILRCLARNPGERIETIRALRLCLELATDAEVASVRPAVAAPASATPSETGATGGAVQTAPASRAPEATSARVGQREGPRASPEPIQPVSNPPRHPGRSARHHRYDPGRARLRGALAVVAALTGITGAWLGWQLWEGHRKVREVQSESPRTQSASAHPPAPVERAGSTARPSAIVGPTHPAVDTPPVPGPPAVSAPWDGSAAAQGGRIGASPQTDANPGSEQTHERLSHGPNPVATLPGAGTVEGTESMAVMRLARRVVVLPAAGAPVSGGVLELGLVDAAPRPVAAIPPSIPRRGQDGTRAYIELILVIDRMGRVASASVYSSSDPSLVEPSLAAARKWRFTPATRQGQPVAVRIAVPLIFESPRP